MKNSNKIYIILSIFASVSLCLAVFLIWPLFKEIKSNSADMISAKNNVVAFGAQTNETNNFKKNYTAYQSNLEKVDQLFVDPNNLVDFFRFLEDTAGSSQVTSQVSLPASSDKSKSFILFQLSSKGNFSDILNFTKQIETGPYLAEVENLSIQNSPDDSSSKSPSSNTFNATFSIKAFIKK